MATVKIVYLGLAALVLATPDYTPEDWDEAALELGRRGYALAHDVADHVLPCGTEIYVWMRQPAPAQVDIVLADALIEVKAQ